MRRRQFVNLVGAGLATIGLTGTVSAGGERVPPNDNIDNTDVYPLPWAASKDDPIQVNTGEWLTHTYAWIDRGNQDGGKEDVNRWLDAVEMRAWIDGEELENAEQYWSDPQYDEERGQYITYWKYSTPPKSPGLHSFAVEHYYPDGYDDDEESREPGTRNRFTGYYEVIPEKGKKK